MLPIILHKIFENSEQEDFSVSILNINQNSSELNVKILIFGHDYEKDSEYEQEWKIETKNYRISKFLFDNNSDLRICEDDPLLWQFSDKQSELYFNGTTSKCDELFVDLCKVHFSLFENHTPFSDSINMFENFKTLIQSENGLLSKGPKKLMIMYKSILEKHNIKGSIVGKRIPTFWNGYKRIEEVGQAKILYINNSYIVADEFVFTT